MDNKTYKQFYITNELKKGIDEVAYLSRIKKSELMRRSALYFLENNKTVNKRFLIKEKNNPDYVRRPALFTVYLEDWVVDLAREVAKEYNSSYGVILFQMIYDYIKICKKFLEIEGNEMWL